MATGHNTLNIDLTGEPSASHNVMATHTPGSNTIESGTNTVEGTGNVVHTGENNINSHQSGNTVETGNNEVSVGGVFKWVKSKIGSVTAACMSTPTKLLSFSYSLPTAGSW